MARLEGSSLGETRTERPTSLADAEGELYPRQRHITRPCPTVSGPHVYGVRGKILGLQSLTKECYRDAVTVDYSIEAVSTAEKSIQHIFVVHQLEGGGNCLDIHSRSSIQGRTLYKIVGRAIPFSAEASHFNSLSVDPWYKYRVDGHTITLWLDGATLVPLIKS